MIRKVLRKLLKSIFTPFLQWRYSKYSNKKHVVSFHGFSISVHPGVFHPGLFFSTEVLWKYLEPKAFSNKHVLELGCGTGALGVWLAKNDAIVSVSDINPHALKNALENASINGVEITGYASDLLEKVPDQKFDWILINPPFYPKNPKTDAEKAWFCEEDYGYFKRLFAQLSTRNNWTNAIMVLSEDCDISTIMEIALKNGCRLDLAFTSKGLIEENFVYQVTQHIT